MPTFRQCGLAAKNMAENDHSTLCRQQPMVLEDVAKDNVATMLMTEDEMQNHANNQGR